MKEKIVLVGGGGHCRSVIDVIEAQGKFEVAGLVEKDTDSCRAIGCYESIGCDDDLPVLTGKFKYFLVTLGQINIGTRREKLFKYLKSFGVKLPIIVSPHAYVSRNVNIAEGTVIMHGAVINTGAKVGRNCIVNTGAIIEHETKVGDHTHVSTGSIINGQCNTGNNVFVGSKAIISNNIQIPDKTIIGAGCVIVKSILESGTYVGIPAQKCDGKK